MTLEELITRLPGEFKTRLEADSYFTDIPVLLGDAGDVAADVAKRLAELTAKGNRRGVSVIVLPILADDAAPNLNRLQLDLQPAFQVVENTQLNWDARGTRKAARAVAVRVLEVIRNGQMTGFLADIKGANNAIEPIPMPESLPTTRAFQVNLTARSQVAGDRTLALPTFSQSEGAEPEFTIAAEAEAVICYTTDDSYPSPNNPAAVTYTGPVPVPEAGVTVRACAYKTGCIASPVSRATITRS
jgi:hypothetical protein